MGEIAPHIYLIVLTFMYWALIIFHMYPPSDDLRSLSDFNDFGRIGK